MFRRVPRETAPPAPELEDPLAGPEGQFAACEVELGLLGGGKIPRGPVPVGARVLHIGVEHRLVKGVADVVVDLGDLLRSVFVLPVQQPRLGRFDEHGGRGADIPVVVGSQRPIEELVQCFAVPHAGHVGFPEAQ